MQTCNGGLRVGLDRIGNGDDSSNPPIHGQIDRCLAKQRRRVCMIVERANIDTAVLHETWIAKQHGLAFDLGTYAETGYRVETACWRQHKITRCGRLHHRLRERMLGPGLNARRYAQHLFFRPARSRKNANHRRMSFGHRTGLVQHHGGQAAGLLQRLAIPYKNAGLGGLADANDDRDRRGQPECARAGDHQHRHGGDQREADYRRRTDIEPDEEGHDRDDQHTRHEHRGNFIGQPANRRFGVLRAPHHFDDARQHRFLADAGGTKQKRPRGIQRSTRYGVSGSLCDRQWLAAEHGLIHVRVAIQNHAVYRNLLTRAHAHGFA